MTGELHDEAAVILADADRLGIEFRADGDLLRFRPKSAMTAPLARRIVEHRASILAVLRADQTQGHPKAPEPTTGREANEEVPGERSPEDQPGAGHVPEGWRPSAWRDNLRRLADHCEMLHPERADYLRARADKIVVDKAPTKG